MKASSSLAFSESVIALPAHESARWFAQLSNRQSVTYTDITFDVKPGPVSLFCDKWSDRPQEIELPVNGKTEGFAFLLSQYWQAPPGIPVAFITVTYEDGAVVRFPIRQEQEIAGSLSDRILSHALVVDTLKAESTTLNISLLAWKNPFRDKTISQVSFAKYIKENDQEENRQIPLNLLAGTSPVMLAIQSFNSAKALNQLLQQLPGNANEDRETVVSVDFSKPQGTISPYIFTTNETGVLSSKDEQWADYLPKLNMMGARMLRFHSGWSLEKLYPDGMGSQDYTRLDQVLDRLVVGDRQVMICFNKIPKYIDPLTPEGRTQFAELAAELVRHVNVEKQYGLTHWEIYNEVYFKAIPEDRSLWLMYNETAAAMRKVDPGIKIGGYAPCWPSVEWLEDFYTHCHAQVDFLSWHKYTTGSVTTSDAIVMAKTRGFGDDVRKIREMAERITPGKQLKTAITEYNINYNWKPHDPRQADYRGAAWFASVLNHLIRNGCDIAMTWHSRGGGTFGLIGRNGDIRPAAHLIAWGNAHIQGSWVETTSNNLWVEALGFQNQGQEGLLLINKSDRPMDVKLNSQDFRPTLFKSISESGLEESACQPNKDFHLVLKPFETRLYLK